MNIDILCVGKIKEKYLRDAIAEYEKRLSRYCKLTIKETVDEKTPDKPTDTERLQVLRKEGDRLLTLIKEKAFVVTLEIKGKMQDSVEFANFIENCGVKGVSDIQFVIGGSLGLDERISKRSDLALSFSRMTFPHQLMRVILLEQVYRGYRIINHEPYHK